MSPRQERILQLSFLPFETIDEIKKNETFKR